MTRTPGTQFRKLLLYPPELRGHKDLRDAHRRFYRFALICAETFEDGDGFAEPVGAQMGVPEGHAELTVSEELLHLLEAPTS